MRITTSKEGHENPFFAPIRGIYPKEYVVKRVFMGNIRGQLQDEVEN